LRSAGISGRNSGVRDFAPGLEGLVANRPVLGAGEPVAAAAKQVVDRPVGGQEPLCLAGRLEAAPLSLLLPSGLVGDFSPIVQPLVLAVLDAGQDLPLGRVAAAWLLSLSVINTRSAYFNLKTSVTRYRLHELRANEGLAAIRWRRG
jgi:hypothetical protein